MADDDYEGNRGDIEPSWEKKFNVNRIKEVLKNQATEYFRDRSYVPEDGLLQAQELSLKIRDYIRDRVPLSRYKISVQVFIGEKKEQKVSVLAKGYWDIYVDNYSFYTYETDSFYCSMIVFGFYTD